MLSSGLSSENILMSSISLVFFALLGSFSLLCLLEKDYTAQIKHAVIGTACIHSWYRTSFFFNSVSILASRIKAQSLADIVIHTKLYTERKRKS